MARIGRIMPTKVDIEGKIARDQAPLPELVIRGFAANDRLKYYLALLQAAEAHASMPGQPVQSLRAEREASGVSDESFDRTIEETRDVGGQTLEIPRVSALVEHLFDELHLMLQPLQAAASAGSDLGIRCEIYRRRLDDLILHAPACHDDRVSVSAITAFTALSRNGHDTIYQLALDLHRELNRLQGSISIDTVDGASSYNVPGSHRELVRAFMEGVNETSPLKFDHPGMATTATGEGNRLTIHNDLSATDAHAIAIQVDGLTATLTYTDAHRPRVRFLQDLMGPYEIAWSAATADAEADTIVGRFGADTPDHLKQYLTYLGSRLVFLVDWNRARKRLARVVRKSDAIAILKWAADNNIGHRAFLQVGDVHLIDTALERADHFHVRPGARLDEWLGRNAARLFLMSVMRTASSGLRAGHSLSLIEDEVEAELLRHLDTADRYVFRGAVDHATAIAALAERLRAAILHIKNGGSAADVSQQTQDLARTWSARADQIARHSSRLVGRMSNGHHLGLLFTEGACAIESLDEAAFLLTLVSPAIDPRTLSLLDSLADLMGGAFREYARCLEEGRELSSASARSDVDGFLIKIDRLVDLNRQATAAKREIVERSFRTPGDFRDHYLVAVMAGEFGQAAASVARCGLIVRDHVLGVHMSR
jgi:hypothetical protein